MTGRRSDSPRDSSRPSSAAAGDRGQSSVVGLALLLGLALVGASAIVVFGAAAVEDTQTRSQVEAAEHVMTQFDSQASLVALDDAGDRSVSFGRIGGRYEVNPGAGHIKVVHLNYSGNSDEEIYEADLGEVVYRNGDTTIAYQGGGVWRSQGSGASTMVSPPEFHYRSATLTFPIIRVGSGSGGSGGVTADISSPKPTSPVYPNASATYDATGPPYRNPASDGQVKVVIQSEYYRAWADYFRDRTDGNVSVDGSAEEVTVKLLSTGVSGDFQMPNEGSSVNIQGVSGHSISDFSITLVPDDTDSARFNNLQWSMYAEEDDTQIEIHLRAGDENSTTGTGCKEVDIETTVYYSPSDGDSNDEDSYHGWTDDNAFKTQCYDGNGDGMTNQTRAIIDFVDDDGEDPHLTYKSLSSSNSVHYDPQHASPIESPIFTEHEGEVSWEPKRYSLNSTYNQSETVDRLINHYFSTMDRVHLTVVDKNSNTITESSSAGEIYYTGGGQYITYMHVTDNEIEVQFD